MTRDEILNLEAGREMDALVADEIMPELIEYRGRFANEYSTDIRAAFEVFDVLRKKFWSTSITQWDHSDKVLIECEYRTGHGEPRKHLDVYADTVPLAICRAALITTLEPHE
jgi:hypothetical protein